MSAMDEIIPKWLLEVNPNSCLSMRDMKKMIGISSQAFDRRMIEGKFPPPDWLRGQVRYWKVKTIINYLRDEHRIVVVTESGGEVKRRVI